MIALVVNSLAGYAFAKLRFRGREQLFRALTAALVIPAQVTMLPLFLMLKELGLINTYWGVIVPGMASIFGIFLVRQKEIDWFYQHGASEIFPDRWREFIAPIPEAERGNLLAAYHRGLNSGDGERERELARTWSVWEGATSSLLANPEREKTFGADSFAPALARIETHYFVNRGFFRSETQLLDDVGRIRHIPAVIVHGRYDVVCPLVSAFDLAARWPEAELRVVPDAGHAAFEPGIAAELVAATARLMQDTA